MAKPIDVLIVKCSFKFDLREVESCQLSKDGRIIAILQRNGKLSLLLTSNGCKIDEVAGRFHSVSWVKGADSEDSTLLAQDNDGHISYYSVFRNDSANVEINRLTHCHRNTLKSLLSEWVTEFDVDVSNQQLCACGPRSAVLNLGKSVALLDVKDGRPPEVRNILDVENVLCVKDGILLGLDNDGKTVNIWDTFRCGCIASLKLSRYTTSKIQHGTIFDNLAFMALIDEEHRLFIIDLNQYFKHYPSSITTSCDSNTEEGEVETHFVDEDALCDISSGKNYSSLGDTFWNNKLSNLGSTSLPMGQQWFENLEIRYPRVASNLRVGNEGLAKQKKAPSSGFSVKKIDEVQKFSSSHQIVIYEKLLGEQGNGVDLKQMYSSGDVLMIHCNEKDGSKLLSINFLKGEESYVNLSHDSVLVPSSSTLFPSLVLTTSGVEMVALDTEKEKLVNSKDSVDKSLVSIPSKWTVWRQKWPKKEIIASMVMLYESAGFADTLCRLNGWDRCTIPIHALEVGLQHRQLDTVAFFLKSRENIFVSHDSNTLIPKHHGASTDLPLPKAGELDLGQVEPAIQLLITTVVSNITDKQSRQFAEQLLHVTLNYLHKVTFHVNDQLTKVRNAGESTDQFEREVSEALHKIMGYIGRLRSCMSSSSQRIRPHENQGSQHQSEVDGKVSDAPSANLKHLTKAQKKLIQNWKKMSQEDAITDGILSGELPILQLYLRQQNKANNAVLPNVIEFGLNKAFELLQQRQLLYSAQIFANLGFDVWTKLRQICLYTPDKALRDYLVSELQSDGHLTDDELDMITFVRRLEGLYTCPSFDLAKELRLEGMQADLEKGADLSDCLTSENVSELVVDTVGDIAPIDVVNSETASYGHFVLEWFRDWDDETKQRVQVDQLIKRRSVTYAEGISSTVIWRYLLAHRDTTRILRWIDSAFQNTEDDMNRKENHDWPYCLPLDPNLFAELHSFDSSWANQILDHLSKRGLFSPNEMEMSALEARLARVNGLFSEPHYLELNPENHGVALYDLHRHMVAKCIEQKLPDLLYFYLDYWKLSQGTNDLLEVGIPRDKMQPWVSMVLHMRAIADDLNDPMRVFNASLSASAFIQSKTSDKLSVSSMLEDGLVGRALATLVYNPEELQEMLSDSSSEAVPSISKWESALSLFPRLRTALCGKPTEGLDQNDVNVYNLLQGNVPFDITQLFGWQGTNGLFIGDMFSEMPHFGSAELSSMFGRRISLTYKYYLRQGRPSFAFCSYIMSILQAGMKTIPSRRLKMVIHETHLLALRKFNQAPVAAACVAFLEMLGHDTTLVRVNLHAATLILDHQAGEITGSPEERRTREELIEKNIAWLLIACVKRRKKQQVEVLSLLEEAVRWHLDRHSLRSSSPEVLGLWQLVLMFCRAHNLPLSTAYLRDCAESDDWLMFLTFAQIHRLEKDQVHAEVASFSKPPLREHLHYVVENVDVISPQAANSQLSGAPIPSRDIRAQLYSRIGLTGAKGKFGESSCESSQSGEDSELTEKEEVATEPRVSVLPSETNFDDVFSLLLACDEKKSPWTCLNAFAIRYRNPVLAVLAACYQEHEEISCLCSWLLASAGDSTRQTMLEYFGDCELRPWTSKDVQSMVLAMTKQSLYKTVLDGFSIFDPECMFLPFLRFCVSFYRYEDQEVCRQHLDTFKEQHTTAVMKLNPATPESPAVIFDIGWVEETIRSILCQFLERNISSYDMGRLLQLLDQKNVTRLFTSESVPDFSKLYRLHQMIACTEIGFNYIDLTLPSEPKYKAECERALTTLEEKRMYNEARVFAEIACIPGEMITMRQMVGELTELQQSSLWQQSEIRCSFWKKCSDTFTKYQVSHPVASSFFQDKLTSSHGHVEYGLLCQLAYDWLQVDDDPSNQKLKKDLFVQMWMSKIHALMENDKGLNDPDDVSWMVDDEKESTPSVQRSDLLQYGHIPSEADTPCVILNSEEKAALESLIGKLLNSGKVKDACQVAALIGHYSQNLTLVITCLRLALGHITPADLNMSIKTLIASPNPRLSRRLSTPAYSLLPLGSYTSLNSFEGNDETENDIVSTIRLLMQYVTNGEFCAKRILVIYQISLVLNTSFEWTVAQDEFVILQSLLNSSHSLRFHLTKDFLSFSQLTPSRVVGFLSDVILKILTSSMCAEEGLTGGEQSAEGSWVSIKNSSSLVLSVIQLCEDHALLGETLHDNMSALLSSNPEMSTTPLNVCVELLIASHQCYTQACSMEGIATVLRTARRLTDILSNAEKYNLLIRLLMGVGRFSEMTYIFDILKQHHHLERLFSKGVDKNESLRMAILDYVQRCHPSDTDTYKMVSLYFTMYREIAAMLEENAYRLLAGLKGKTLDASGDTQAALQSAVHFFSDAAESYAKEDCLRHAQQCVKNARLVALQLQLLHSGHRVINLTKEEVASFVTSHAKFWEAHIVADAYDKHIHWAGAICKRAIIHGDHKYLTELQAHVKLTPSLITDVVESFKHEAQKPKSATGHMKKLLTMCNDVQTSYRLAQGLGYTEFARELLKGDNGAYLRDVLGVPY